METAIQEYRTEIVEASASPQEMTLRLQDMKQKLNLVQQFFNQVMVPNQDYGVIPGTEKPTLLKPGAEKLCELYGYAPTVKHVEEEANKDTGFYRARVTVALVHRRTGVTVAEGVGEANTMEGRYRWRWTPEWKLPKGIDISILHSEERTSKGGKKFIMYKIENDDPYTLWNTVLKMAKKRGMVDAALSATRSSGLFTQDLEDLKEWVSGGEGEYQQSTQQQAQSRQQPPKPTTNGSDLATEAQRKKIYAMARGTGYEPETIKSIMIERYHIDDSTKLTKKNASDFIEYLTKLESGEIGPMSPEEMERIANNYNKEAVNE